MLTAAATKTRACLHRERTARTQGAAAAGQAHFAAVMGNAIDSVLQESEDYRVYDCLTSDRDLQSALDQVRQVVPGPHVSPVLHMRMTQAMSNLSEMLAGHVRWTLDESRAALLTSLTSLTATDSASAATNPSADSSRISGAVAPSSEEIGVVGSIEDQINHRSKETNDAFDELDRQIQLGITATSRRVNKIREDYNAHTLYLTEKALILQAILDAIQEITCEEQRLTREWTGSLRELYRSDEIHQLQTEKKSLDAEQFRHETEIQRYFDHSSQGSMSGKQSEKTDKVKLTLATDLESRKAGFRQIQLIDLYCLQRANEMWAILPSIQRVGHDVDPIKCMHWRPIIEDMPEAIKPFWVQQSKAFATKLFGQFTPTQRSHLLASHEVGTDKVQVQISEDCGVSLYWLLIQLYHPIDRARRRALEQEIAQQGRKFRTENPEAVLKELVLKHQEAMDIQCRLKWDTVALPLIRNLSDRNTLFTVRLEPFQSMVPSDPDDSVTELGELLRAVSTTLKDLKGRVNWDTSSAKAARDDTQGSADRIRDLEEQVKALQAKLVSLIGHANAVITPKLGYCWAKGCQRQITGFKKGTTDHWRLCGTCLLKLRETNTPVPLIDGTEYGQRRAKKVFQAIEEGRVESPLPSTPSSPTSPSKAKAAKGSKGRGKGGKGDKKGGRGTKRGRANAAHEADGAEEVNWEDQEAEYDYSDEEPQNAKRARDTVEANNSESELLGIDWY